MEIDTQPNNNNFQMRNTLTLPFTTDGETDPRKATLGSYLTTLVVLLFDLQALQAFSFFSEGLFCKLNFCSANQFGWWQWCLGSGRLERRLCRIVVPLKLLCYLCSTRQNFQMKKEKAAARIFFSSPLSLANYFDGLLLSKFLFPAALQPFVMLQWLINHNCRKRLSLFIWDSPMGHF